MGLARSTFYDVGPVPLEPAELVVRIGAICDEFECYGYRRVGAALPYVAERDTPLGRSAKGLMSRAHRNVAVVAFANKLARIAWAVLRRGERFAAGGMSMVA